MKLAKFLLVGIVAGCLGWAVAAESAEVRNDIAAKGDFLSEGKNPSVVSLRFSWNMAVGAAAFDRYGMIWIVFDKPSLANAKQLMEEAKGLAKEIYVLPHPLATIVIIEPQKGIDYKMRREGLLWLVDLYQEKAPESEDNNVTIFTQVDGLKNIYLFVPTGSSGNAVSMLDPMTGETMLIFTSSQPGLSNKAFYRYVDFDVLKTVQGMAFVVNSPDIVLNRGNSGITLKALGRSLNITSDLENLKQQQIAGNNKVFAAGGNIFDLQLSPEVAEKTLLDAIADFEQKIEDTPKGKRAELRFMLAKYYVYNGMGYEAAAIFDRMSELNMPESKTEYFHVLAGIADVLSKRWADAKKHFKYGRIRDNDEGKLWLAIIRSAQKFSKEDNDIILKYGKFMSNYPQPIKDVISVIAARNAIAVEDDLLAQNFIDVLNSVQNRALNLQDQIAYLSGSKLEMQGYWRNAVKEYKKLLTVNSAMFSAYGRLHYTVLDEKLEQTNVDDAIAELEKLRFAWGETDFQRDLLKGLSELYIKKHDYYNALRVLGDLGYLEDSAGRVNVSRKMVKVFEDVFIGNHADEYLTPIKALSLYNEFNWLKDLSDKRVLIMQKLADRLVEVDLLAQANDMLLEALEQYHLDAEDTGRIGARLAVIYLFEQQPKKALDILAQTQVDEIDEDMKTTRRFIKARALAELGQVNEALDLLDNDFSLNAMKYKFELYWRAEDWDNASNVIKYLVKEPIKGKALSKEQIGYILDWATALKKSGKDAVLARLRNKFLPYFEGTEYAPVFNVLTGSLDREVVDINKIRSVINDIQSFNDFAHFYIDSMKEKIE